MDARIRSLLGRRRAILSLALLLALAGVMWFTMLNGVGAASAHGGPSNGAVDNSVIQDQREPAPVNSCLLPWFPC